MARDHPRNSDASFISTTIAANCIITVEMDLLFSLATKTAKNPAQQSSSTGFHRALCDHTCSAKISGFSQESNVLLVITTSLRPLSLKFLALRRPFR